MHHLLVPVDPQSAQRTQTAVAAAISRSRSGPVHVHLASVQPPVSWHVAMFFGRDELQRLQAQAGHEEMAGAHALLDAVGVVSSEHVRVGWRAETIATLARDLGCDTVLLGDDPDTVGRLFGSVASQVRHLLQGPAGTCQVIGS